MGRFPSSGCLADQEGDACQGLESRLRNLHIYAVFLVSSCMPYVRKVVGSQHLLAVQAGRVSVLVAESV